MSFTPSSVMFNNFLAYFFHNQAWKINIYNFYISKAACIKFPNSKIFVFTSLIYTHLRLAQGLELQQSSSFYLKMTNINVYFEVAQGDH